VCAGVGPRHTAGIQVFSSRNSHFQALEHPFRAPKFHRKERRFLERIASISTNQLTPFRLDPWSSTPDKRSCPSTGAPACIFPHPACEGFPRSSGQAGTQFTVLFRNNNSRISVATWSPVLVSKRVWSLPSRGYPQAILIIGGHAPGASSSSIRMKGIYHFFPPSQNLNLGTRSQNQNTE